MAVKKGKRKVEPITCEFCHHTWVPRVADPVACPRCHNYRGKREFYVRPPAGA